MAERAQLSTTMYSDIDWRVSDLDRMPEGYRYEIINGVLYMAAPRKWPHPQLVTNLMRILLPAVESLRLEVFAPKTGVYYNERHYLDPNLLVLRQDQLPRNGQDHPETGVVAAEVVSRSNLRAPRADRETLFFRAGIDEIWYVDHQTRSLEVCRRGETGYRVATVFQGHARVTSESLPGLEFPLAAVWKNVAP